MIALLGTLDGGFLMPKTPRCICRVDETGYYGDLRSWIRLPFLVGGLLLPVLLALEPDALTDTSVVLGLVLSAGCYLALLWVTASRLLKHHGLLCSVRYAFLRLM